MKVLEIYENKILQIFYESVNQIKRKLKIEVQQEDSLPMVSLLPNFIAVTHFCSYKKNKVNGEFPLIFPVIYRGRKNSTTVVGKNSKHDIKAVRLCYSLKSFPCTFFNVRKGDIFFIDINKQAGTELCHAQISSNELSTRGWLNYVNNVCYNVCYN